MATALFDLGKIAATPGMMEVLRRRNNKYVTTCVAMHQAGMWGMVDAEDREANNAAVKWGQRVLSSWPLPDDAGMFWIITEADRSLTTLLLPSEY